jgi:uroporphyrin-III C-methyltransferase
MPELPAEPAPAQDISSPQKGAAPMPPMPPEAQAGSSPTPPSPPKLPKFTLFLLAVAAAALLLSLSLWMRLSSIQEALARQSLDATTASVEGRTLAKAAQDAVKEIAARQALLEGKISEVALQRTQLEELMQSLSRSRDENLVVDVDSALRLAQQQANLTGSLEPLLAALRSAEQRVGRAAQPRLAPLQRALAKDMERVKSANVADTPSLLIKLDELVRLVDDMPLANAVALAKHAPAVAAQSTLPTRQVPAQERQGSGVLAAAPDWLKAMVGAVRDEARSLVRVSRIDTPEAALLSPEQSFFARENLKLKLLNARLALLSRQFDTTRNDLTGAAKLTTRYFDVSAKPVQQAGNLMAQLQSQLQRAEQPRIDDTLAALATLSASTTQGR